MKQGKQLTTGKRIIFFILLAVVVELAFFVAGFFMGVFEGAGFDVNTLLLMTRTTMLLGVVAFAYLLYKSFTTFKRYQASEEEDDEVVDELYKTTFRSLEYATIIYNISAGLVLFNLILGTNYGDYSSSTELVDLIGFLILLPAQIAIVKVTQTIRRYKLSAFPTPNEMKDYMYALDEGERQANFEQSFLIVFNLNQWVLPLLYAFVGAVSFISQTQQLLALGIVAFIQIYINLMNVRMVRQYFK